MKILLGAAAVIACTTLAHADTFCAELSALAVARTPGATLGLPPPFGTTATCTTALAQSGETSTHCAWPFDYRADAASEAFAALVQAVPACLGSATAGTRDQDVNHPDFYDLRVFRHEAGQVGVSIKDKGGLQQTYVFVRVAPAG